MTTHPTNHPGEPNPEMKSGYAEVNGLSVYYEIHGQGQPLVLLHGALSTIGIDFGLVLPALARTRQIIAVEYQAHGHTTDIDRPLTYVHLANDTVALLHQLGINKADFFGYSVGGAIATQIGISYPEMARKLVLAGGTTYNPSGVYSATQGETKPEDLIGTVFYEEYKRIAPNPDNWGKLIEKINQLDHTDEGWPAEVIASIKAPVLIIVGDSDIVRPEHVVEMFRLLGGGVPGDVVGLPKSQLAILPGTTHLTLVHRADWLLSMTTEFFDKPETEEELRRE